MKPSDLSPSVPKRTPWLAWATAAFPLAWLGLFYLFVMRARWTLGRWPAPYHPDPKDLGFDFHHLAIDLGLVASPVAALAVLAWAIVRWRRASRPTLWPHVSLVVASEALVLSLARLDPGQFFEWFAD